MTTMISDAERNAEADRAAAQISHLAVHVLSPDTTGVGEASGGSPAYGRQAVTFNAAGTDGPLGATLQPATVGVAWSSQVTFDLPAGSYNFWGGWSAATGGTYKRGNQFVDVQTLTVQGQIKLSVAIGPYVGA